MARRLTSTEWFGISVLAILVAACSYALGAITGSWLVGLASLILFPLALASLIGAGLAVAFVTVAIHEAGHFYAGRRAGLEPVVFHLMFWEWVRWKGSARCRRHRGSRQLTGTVHVVCWDEPPSLRKYFFCVAAGPLASFAAAGLVLGSYLLLGGDFTIENLNAMSYVWLWFGAMNLLMFVFSAIPCGSKEGPASDGLVLWNLLRHQERSRAELRFTRVFSLAYAGVSSRHFDYEAIQKAEVEAPSGGDRAVYRYLRYCVEWDRRDRINAYRTLLALEQERAEFPTPLLGDVVTCCLVYAGGMLDEPAGEFVERLNQVEESPELIHLLARAKAVAAFRQGDLECHMRYVEECRARLSREIEKDASDALKDELKQIEEIASLALAPIAANI